MLALHPSRIRLEQPRGGCVPRQPPQHLFRIPGTRRTLRSPSHQPQQTHAVRIKGDTKPVGQLWEAKLSSPGPSQLGDGYVSINTKADTRVRNGSSKAAPPSLWQKIHQYFLLCNELRLSFFLLYLFLKQPPEKPLLQLPWNALSNQNFDILSSEASPPTSFFNP